MSNFGDVELGDENDENENENEQARERISQAEMATQAAEQTRIREQLETELAQALVAAEELRSDFEKVRAHALALTLERIASQEAFLNAEQRTRAANVAHLLREGLDRVRLRELLGFDFESRDVASIERDECSRIDLALTPMPDLNTPAISERLASFKDAVSVRYVRLTAEATQQSSASSSTGSPANTGPLGAVPPVAMSTPDANAAAPQAAPTADPAANNAAATDPAAVTQTASTETRPDNEVGEHRAVSPWKARLRAWKAWLGAFVGRKAGSAWTGLARARRRYGRKALRWAFCLAGIVGLWYGANFAYEKLETARHADASTEARSSGTPQPPTSTVAVADETSDEVPSPPEVPAENVSTEPVPATSEAPEGEDPPAEPAPAELETVEDPVEPGAVAASDDEPTCVPYTETPRCATDRVLPTADDAPFRRPHWDCGRTELVMRDGRFDVCTPGCSYCYFPSSS